MWNESNFRIKGYLSNQVTALGAARGESGDTDALVGSLSHMPLWPTLLSESLSLDKRSISSPFFRAQSYTKLLSFSLPTSFYSLAFLCPGFFAHIAFIATFNHIMQ